ncbi:alpha-L RNA-binding motif-containing protein [Laetiporus sulphureus 93-53]|uniref:Alpha-L RNA-binding motif-containing protein n=1 Tax=Laetiporus sulphureus 93-53 TaxID=1314785 RepID=A0A165EB92_9APHY|nr:alpha-L RNA-binding motif-containing protein [Laetiporus sulphureus 93-53]KZT06646.1 alpha-L RNA-binding motif-containing protein [Laetiporus sulphureus 93-53]
MRDANVYNLKRAMPRMSWGVRNLYNLWQRSFGGKTREIDFSNTHKSLFQQRWIAKALLRAYHGDYIPEKVFKRWYLPEMLPDVRSHVAKSANLAALNKWAHRDMAAEKEVKRIELEQAKGLAPVGSLMFREVERRIDVLVFRCCFAHSVYEARRLIIHGEVMLNGQKHTLPNTRLAPGDMISVNPKAIRFLKASAAPKKEITTKVSEEDEEQEKETESSAAENSAETDSAEKTKGNSEAATSGTASDVRDASESRAKEEPKSPKPKRKSDLTPFHLPPYASPSIFIPAYIEPSFATCSAIYVRHPTARPGYSEIPTPYDADGELVRAAWEWYSHVRPRIRSKRQLARMPENRQISGRAVYRERKNAEATA